MSFSSIKASVSSGVKAAASKVLTKTAATIAATAIVVAGVGSVGAYKLAESSYKAGCVDGAAIGFASLLSFAAQTIIQDREKNFGKMCGELGQLHARGKSLEDLKQ